MCDMVTIDGKSYDTPRELMDKLGGELVPAPEYGDILMDCCLCQVDLKATAEKYGYEYKPFDGDPTDVEFVKRDG